VKKRERWMMMHENAERQKYSRGESDHRFSKASRSQIAGGLGESETKRGSSTESNVIDSVSSACPVESMRKLDHTKRPTKSNQSRHKRLKSKFTMRLAKNIRAKRRRRESKRKKPITKLDLQIELNEIHHLLIPSIRTLPRDVRE
jgi:predicted nucleotidyltransferase